MDLRNLSDGSRSDAELKVLSPHSFSHVGAATKKNWKHRRVLSNSNIVSRVASLGSEAQTWVLTDVPAGVCFKDRGRATPRSPVGVDHSRLTDLFSTLRYVLYAVAQ